VDAGFDSVAAYYEVLSDNAARLEREGPFLAECLEKAPGKRVADIACGTGLHAEFLAGLGADVTAADASPDMIAYARKNRSHAGIRYEIRDMREVSGEPYDLVLCIGNSLCLLPSIADADAVFASASSALATGGLFVMQILNYASEANQKPRYRVDARRRDERDIVALKSLVPRGDRTLLSLAFYALGDGLASSASETAVLMNLSREQLSAAAEKTRLRTLGVYGSYGKAAYEPLSSSDLVCVFEKPVADEEVS